MWIAQDACNCRQKEGIIGGSCHKYNFCCDTTFVETNTYFVVTKVCLSRQRFCRAKLTFVTTKDVFVAIKHLFCHDKSMLVATNIFCCDKQNCVATKASILLSRQKTCFVATKMILVAASANDKREGRQRRHELKHHSSKTLFICSVHFQNRQADGLQQSA